MISPHESASLLLQTIRPLIIVPDNVAEADVLLAIVAHIQCDRHHLTVAVAQNATGLLPNDEDDQ
jgi:hypothetical protein